MLSVIIPTRDSEEGLARTLASLVPAAAEGVVREVVVVDAGSRDGTRVVADAAGCTLIEAKGTWVERIGAGVTAARRAPWFAFLAPNVFLEGDWFREAASFVDRIERGGRGDTEVATFRLAFDDFGWKARLGERVVALAGGLFGKPLREQGLLISRRHWENLSTGAAPRVSEGPVAQLSRSVIHTLRADAVVLPRDGVGALPSGGRLARIALGGVGLGEVAALIDDA
jgi:glycosyltransferase involved in cell wall biosynthesis